MFAFVSSCSEVDAINGIVDDVIIADDDDVANDVVRSAPAAPRQLRSIASFESASSNETSVVVTLSFVTVTLSVDA